VVFGLFVIMVTGIIKESGLAVFLLSFFRVNVSEVYSWGISAILALFVKLPCKGVIEELLSGFIDMLRLAKP